jgi:hypothetical protein
MILFGGIALIGGYSLFRSMLPLWGFILGGWVTFSFCRWWCTYPSEIHLISGYRLFWRRHSRAAIATPLYYVIIFLSGAALGGIAGVMIGAVVDIGGINSFRNVMTSLRCFFLLCRKATRRSF